MSHDISCSIFPVYLFPTFILNLYLFPPIQPNTVFDLESSPVTFMTTTMFKFVFPLLLPPLDYLFLILYFSHFWSGSNALYFYSIIDYSLNFNMYVYARSPKLIISMSPIPHRNLTAHTPIISFQLICN